MSEYSRALGDTVRAARKKMGLSQNKVAALIDADERTIMNIETYNANTTMDVLYPLIRILRIDPRVSVKPPRDLHLHSQYVTILPYSSR